MRYSVVTQVIRHHKVQLTTLTHVYQAEGADVSLVQTGIIVRLKNVVAHNKRETCNRSWGKGSKVNYLVLERRQVTLEHDLQRAAVQSRHKSSLYLTLTKR